MEEPKKPNPFKLIPWTLAPLNLPFNIIPHDETQEKILQVRSFQSGENNDTFFTICCLLRGLACLTAVMFCA